MTHIVPSPTPTNPRPSSSIGYVVETPTSTFPIASAPMPHTVSVRTAILLLSALAGNDTNRIPTAAMLSTRPVAASANANRSWYSGSNGEIPDHPSSATKMLANKSHTVGRRIGEGCHAGRGRRPDDADARGVYRQPITSDKNNGRPIRRATALGPATRCIRPGLVDVDDDELVPTRVGHPDP